MKTICINVVANGYVVENGEAGSVVNPYVFETFDALTAWLKSNLQTPPENRAGAKTE